MPFEREDKTLLKSDEKYQDYVKILEEELIPAMGCTEPIAIAYAGAVARETLGCLPDELDIQVSGNIIKNVKSVIVPNTGGMRGIAAALRLIQADMSSYDQMMNFVTRIKKETDHVDWLVNNVGISTYAKYEDYTFEEWSKIVNTNLSVPVFLVKELRPIIREGGSILFTGSYAGQQAYSSSLVYGVTKSAIHFLTKSLVKELEPKQIRVNAIAPGFIETSWHKNRTPESYERINRKIALHRFGEISEVADMAYEILKNGYMNGSIVDIHGGYDYF